MTSVIRAIIIFLCILFSFQSIAQTGGSIKGVITDNVFNESVIGATIRIDGTGIGAVTDIEGNYILKNIKPGKYNLLFSYLSYKTDTVQGVEVIANQTTTVDKVLEENAEMLGEVVIMGVRQTNTEAAIIQEVKEAKQVVSAVSAEQIEKSQDRDAAQVMKRIPGITLIDGKFIMVRGLSQRYNAVLFNGISAPSTEPESRSFAFDIINSSMIDRLLIYKSGTPDLPGEFAGSVIQLYTKNVPNENYLKVGISVGYRSGTTGKDFTQSGDFSMADRVTFGLTNRRWSAPILSKRVSENAVVAGGLTNEFDNNWTTNSVTALPDMSFSLQTGKTVMVMGKNLSNITDVSFSNSYLFKNSERGQYYLYGSDGAGTSKTQNRSFDKESDFGSSLNILCNFALLLNENNKFSFNNSYVRLVDAEVLERQYYDYLNNRDQKRLSMRYQNRAIYTGQLMGDHKLKNKKTELNWVMGYSRIDREEPDWKRFTTQKTINSNEPYSIPLSTPNIIVRFNSDLKDNNMAFKTDVSHLLTGTSETPGIKIKGGAFYEFSNRNYQARLIQYKRSPGDNFNENLTKMPISELMQPENLGFPNGLILNETTTLRDKYLANSLLYGAHLGASIPFFNNKFNLLVGGRLELFNQQLEGNDGASPQKVDVTYVNPLPFFNLSYNIDKNMLVRAGYSQTVNRPAFRELAPFQFYDFTMNAQITGSPELVQANIHNYDLRWELYPSEVEAISLGVFHKQFYNPIEMIYRQNENYNFTFRNAKSATASGVELEVKKSAAKIAKGTFMENFSLLFNASWIYSRIQLDGSVGGLVQNRPMQGQSPYVVNTGIYYNNDEKGINASVMYNVFGQRTFFVGDVQTRSVYELPRNLVDLTISKKTGKKGEVKFGITNLLNAAYRLYEDGDSSGKIERNNANDKVFYTYQSGQRFTIGYSYKF